MDEELIVGLVVAFLFGLPVGGFAVQKGYNFVIWFLAAVVAVLPPLVRIGLGYNFFIWLVASGLVGLIVLAYLPYTNRGELPPAVAGRRRAMGNAAGAALAALSIGLGVVLLGSR